MKIQLKRSNVLDNGEAKAPSAGQMEYGELAVNYNSTDPAVFIKNSDDSIVRVTGSTYWDADGENLYPTTSNGDVLIGGTLPSSPAITLENSGDGTFTGSITATSFIGDGSQLTGAGSLPPASNTAPSNPNINDFWVDSSACPPEIKIYTDCAGSPVWESLTGTGSLAPPAINVVALGNTQGGPRFTNKDFDVTIAMAVEGIPVSQKSVKGTVEAFMQNYPSTDLVSSRTESFPSSAPNSGFSAIGDNSYFDSSAGVVGYFNSSGILNFMLHLRSTQGGGPELYFSNTGSGWNGPNGLENSIQIYQPMYNVANKYISAGQSYCSTDTPTTWIYSSAYGRFCYDGTHYIGIKSIGGEFGVSYGATPELMFNTTANQTQLSSSYQSGAVTTGTRIACGGGTVMVVGNSKSPNYTNTCHVSYDSGVTWTQKTNPGNDTQEPTDLMYFNGAFYMIWKGSIWKTTNTGSSWTQTLAPNNGYFMRIQNDGKYLYAVYTATINSQNYGGSANECGLMRSINNSASWELLNSANPGGTAQNDQNYRGAYTPTVDDLAFIGGQYVEIGKRSELNQNGNLMYNRSSTGSYGTQTLTLASNLNLGGDGGINVGDTVRSTTSSLNLVVKSIDASVPSIMLSGAPSVEVGGKVVSLSPIGAGSNQTRYLLMNGAGQVTNLVDTDPGFVSTGPGTSITVQFPSSFDGTGNAPDDDLPVGASIQVEVQALNSEGGSTALSNILTPTPDVAAMAALVAAKAAAAATSLGTTYSANIAEHPPIETPIAIDGYYPLYESEEAAAYHGNGYTHTHVVDGVTYYMPDGGVIIYHGDYTG